MKKLPYPKEYSQKDVFVKVPKLVRNKFLAHNVNIYGIAIPQPIYNPHSIISSCQRECNTHNEFHGWSKEQVRQILKQVDYVK